MGISEIFYNLDIEIESSKQEINNYIYDNYISKDIIRKIIKELSNQNYNNYELSVALRKSLEKLLEE